MTDAVLGNLVRGGISATSLNFTGQRLDSGIGLLYYHARYYDPALARFVSADTIVPGQADKAGTPNPQHLNRYTYVGNNPVSKTDPSGHDWEHLAQFAIGVAEGAISTVSSIVETSTPYGAARVGVNIGMAIGSDPAGFVQGVKDKVNTVIQGGKFAVSDPSGAVTALYEESRGLGRVLGTALGTAALGKAGKLITNEIAEDTVASVAPDLDNLDKHALQSMAKRNWTKDQIMEAFEQGEAYPAIDKTAGGASATRYIHPETGKSVIVNNETGRVIHVGKKGFIYDE